MSTPRLHAVIRCQPKNTFSVASHKMLDQQRVLLFPLIDCATQFRPVGTYPIRALAKPPRHPTRDMGCPEDQWKGQAASIHFCCGIGDDRLRNVESSLACGIELFS